MFLAKQVVLHVRIYNGAFVFQYFNENIPGGHMP